jgi:peptidyl-prolyl cis-trans isomerase SurA
MTMRTYVTVAVLLVIAGCAGSGAIDTSPVVARIGTTPITLNELNVQFDRNTFRNDSILDRSAALREFLPLYTDYRVKLRAADEAGYLRDADLLAELEQYERQTAYPYWMENRIKDQLLDEFMRRSSDEVQASHILISLSENASPADTLRIWNRLNEARAKALAGADFDSLSAAVSSMQQGRSMGGDLGYFSAGWAVKEFEDAAYATEVGGISMPFRTRFGYHIVHVRDRRPATPDRLVSHVYFQSSPDPASIEEAMERASEAVNRLASGEAFMEVAIALSEDGQSGPTGGQIGWVNHGRYLATFTDPVMAAAVDGTPTAPFYSGYGVHIVRIDSVRRYDSIEAERAEKLERLKQLPHFRDSKATTIATVRRTANETVHTAALDNFESAIRNNRNQGIFALDLRPDLLRQPVYTLRGTNHSLAEYIQWLPSKMDTSRTDTYQPSFRDDFFSDMADRQIIDITRTEFPAFAELSLNYVNGLAIFKISEDSIWNYAKADSASIRRIYEENRSKYRFDARHFYIRLTASHDSTLQQAKAALLAGVATDSLRNEIRGLLVRSDQTTTLEGEPQSRLTGLQAGEFTEVFDFRGRPTMLHLQTIEEARDMRFDEAYFRVVTDYQPIRERTWLERMRARYGVTEYPNRIP